MTHLPPFPNRYVWQMLAACACLTAALGIYQGFAIHPFALLVGLTVLTGMLAISHVYTTWRPDPKLAYPPILVAYFVAKCMIFGPLSYIVASFPLPLRDATFAALDPVFGFDWQSLQQFTANSAVLSRIANLIYNFSGLQIFLVWIVLGLTGQFTRLSVFLTAMLLATIACVVIAGLFPAMDAYAYYAVPASALGHLNTQIGGLVHMADLQALRDGSLRLIDLSKLEGLVTFPSFHTVVALTCAWGLWRTRWIAIPAAMYSGLVVVTTLPVGGHYLADVIAGALISWATIAAAWRLEAQAGAEPQARATHAPAGVTA